MADSTYSVKVSEEVQERIKQLIDNSCKVNNPLGTAQGSILGPLISNIYLHRFDVWIRDQGDCWHNKEDEKFHNYANRRKLMGLTNLKIGIHVRYADDILILCKKKSDAEKFKYSITKYLTKNMKLTINEEKTKIYDLTKERMKYLGYVFYVCKRNVKNVRQKAKYLVSNILSKTKEETIVNKCSELLKKIREKTSYETIHAWNTYVVGIHDYYKGMTHFNECFSRIGWRIYKAFYHTMNKRVKFITDQSYKNNFMKGKYSLWGKTGYYCFENYQVIQINWANWDSKLISAIKGKVSRKNPYAYGDTKHKPGVTIEDISYLVKSSTYIKNSRLGMYRISKYSSSKGSSYISGEYVAVDKYHCHHIIPISKGGTNEFKNLCVLSKEEHSTLHSSNPEKLYDMYPKKKKQIKNLINHL